MNDFIRAIAWPLVVLVLGIIYRKELPRLVQALAARVSRLSAVGITLELVAAKPVPEIVSVRLDEIRRPAGPSPRSGEKSLLDLVKSSRPAEYVIIDLRNGSAWLTSRLYLFASVLPRVSGLRCFVFVGNQGQIPRYFLGLASPDLVARVLEERYPWLRKARIVTELQLKLGLQDFTQQQAISQTVESLAGSIDLFTEGQQVENFVTSFLKNPNLTRPHNPAAGDADWVKLDGKDEHARWIGGEQGLFDLLGTDLGRQKIILDPRAADEDLVKSVLRQQGNFVAATDAEGRFDRLIDRGALLDKVVAQAAGQ